MPFSSGRSVRAPASKATSTVVARVPSISIRWIGRPEGRVEDSIRAIFLSNQAAAATLAAALQVEHVGAVHEDRVAARVLDLAEAVRSAGFGRQPRRHVLERAPRLEVAAVHHLDADSGFVCHRRSLLQCRFQEGACPWRTKYPAWTRWPQPNDKSAGRPPPRGGLP